MGWTPPPGWLSLERHVARKSLAAPYRKQMRMGLGLYCSWDCFVRALPRLRELNRELNERGVGLKRLRPGEAPRLLPPPVTKGGPT
jgi:hypothetical protein